LIKSPPEAEADSRGGLDPGSADRRLAVYLVAAAEISFFAALLGAWLVLKFTERPAGPGGSSSIAVLAAAMLALHVIVGFISQLSGLVRAWIMFLTITAVLMVLCAPMLLVH
jgi:hypothetical protein